MADFVFDRDIFTAKLERSEIIQKSLDMVKFILNQSQKQNIDVVSKKKLKINLMKS